MRDKASLLLQLIQPREREILDVGCGEGALAKELTLRGKSVVGIELDPGKASLARENCRHVIQGDAEDLQTVEAVRAVQSSFDLILFSEILEHVRRPEEVLRSFLPLLKPSGVVVAVVPNVAFYKTRLTLLRGEWNYASEGILDRTHLRFLTKKSLKTLFEGTGLTIQTLIATHYSRRFSFLYDGLSAWFPELFGEQFVVRAQFHTASP